MSQQPTWDATYQRYFHTVWDETHGRWYRTHHVEGQGWVFFDWLPPITRNDSVVHSSGQAAGSSPIISTEGAPVWGSYNTNNPSTYEPLDPSNYNVGVVVRTEAN
ncbi:hypothetical protein CUC08_Gglean001729 [Alternaria sp. MG1]|nr:hypothetical protein CUC08_Gglean001729 [Alternaria sp. MG1]